MSKQFINELCDTFFYIYFFFDAVKTFTLQYYTSMTDIAEC